MRVGDYAGALRCAGESAEVQERAGNVPGRVRADCGGTEVAARSPTSRAAHAREIWHPARPYMSGGGKGGQPRLSLRELFRGYGIL